MKTRKTEFIPSESQKMLRDVEAHCDASFNVNVKLLYCPLENTVTIDWIASRSMGHGNGSAALKYICDFVDKYSLRTDLIPTADFSYNEQRLIDWYSRFGFKYSNHQMFREPMLSS